MAKQAKHEPTTAAELEALTVADLADLATKRGATVLRGDGEEGEPLKADYVKALAGTTATGARVRQTPKFVNARGDAVNEDGDRVDEFGVAIDNEP